MDSERIVGWGVHNEDPYVKITIRTRTREHEFTIGPGFGKDFGSLLLSVSTNLFDEISARVREREGGNG